MADGFEGGSYFVMDYLEFSGRADPTLFGRKMAEMHLAEPLAAEAKAGRFGFDVDLNRVIDEKLHQHADAFRWVIGFCRSAIADQILYRGGELLGRYVCRQRFHQRYSQLIPDHDQKLLVVDRTPCLR